MSAPIADPGSQAAASTGPEHIYRALAHADGTSEPFDRIKAICHSSLDLLPVTGAGVMLMAERVHQGTLYATDERIQRLEQLQNAAAEGPCIDCYLMGRPVLEPDLASDGLRAWPLLAVAALEVGIGALFSFPLELDNASVGALDLFRDRPGPLNPDQVADARLLAAMATREVLALQAAALPGSLPSQISDLSGDRATIEQATGMVSVQLGTSIHEAGRRLRQVTAEQGGVLAEVAGEVVARTLRLD